MKLILIISGSYPSCSVSKKIWLKTCVQNDIELEVFDMENSNGRNIAEILDLKTFPALISDGKVIAVGQPDSKTAEKLIAELLQNIKLNNIIQK